MPRPRIVSCEMAARVHPHVPGALALVVIAATNLLLKLPTIGSDGIWLDEALSLHVAQAPVSLLTLAANDPTPPLYYLLLCGWVRLFGISLESARLLSVVLSTATACLLFDLARRHFDLATAVVASALFTASRLQLFYAHEARCYALVGLLCVASFDLFLALVARPSWPKAIALALANAGLLYTHYVALFALVAQGAAALLFARRQRAFLRYYVASQTLAALLFAPWLRGIARDGIAQKDWIGPPTLSRARYVLKRFAGSSTLLVGYAVLAFVTPLARRWRRAVACDGAKLATLALWTLAPIALAYAASFARGMLVDRYVLYASLGFYLLVAHVIALAPLPRAQRALLGLAVVGLSLHGTLTDPQHRHDWRSATAIVRSEALLGSAVVVAPYWQFRPLAYYLDRDAFHDFAHTRARLEAGGVILTEDVRSLRLAPRRHVLVLGPEIASGVTGTERWLEEQGFAVVRREDLYGLALLVAVPRAAATPVADQVPAPG